MKTFRVTLTYDNRTCHAATFECEVDADTSQIARAIAREHALDHWSSACPLSVVAVEVKSDTAETINRLRRWHTTPENACATFKEASCWTHDRPERPAMDKARDAVAMLSSFVNLTESAMLYRDADEDGDIEEQVAVEATELALQYCEELLHMTHNNKRDREIAAHLETAA